MASGADMTWTLKESFNRIEKLLMDGGQAASAEDAATLLRSFRMQFVAGPEVRTSPVLQAALLTATNTARRSIHGEVIVAGDLEAPLHHPLPGFSRLSDAVRGLGADLRTSPVRDVPTLIFGSASSPITELALQVTFDGWAGGVIPVSEKRRLDEGGLVALSGTLAGAIGVTELFESLRGRDPRAGRRLIGLSAWNPRLDWMSAASRGPVLQHLPNRIWIIGLGHLGQAFLWNLALLPYAASSDVLLVLQDFDRLVPANWSTSPLTLETQLGCMKTRAMAEWAESRGFNTTMVERPFAGDFSLNHNDPRLAFCGVDNREARAAMEDVGFEAVVEAGLGAGEEFLAYQIHCFPNQRSARNRWGTKVQDRDVQISEPIRRHAARNGLDECGLTELAGIRVGASFVGTVATALALGQILRPLHDSPMHGAISGKLTSPRGADVTESGRSKAVRYGSIPVVRSYCQVSV